MPSELLYVTDPMCSWCYGFRSTLEIVSGELMPGVRTQLVMGGLAPDDEVPMDAATRDYVQRSWHAVEAATGARFEHGFWSAANTPKRSTWPACRAVIAAGTRGPEMLRAIQDAFYLQARDPSDRRVLVQLAGELGLPDDFEGELDAEPTRAKLAADFELRDRLGASGFPSIGVRDAAGERLLVRGWVDDRGLRSALGSAGLLQTS